MYFWMCLKLAKIVISNINMLLCLKIYQANLFFNKSFKICKGGSVDKKYLISTF